MYSVYLLESTKKCKKTYVGLTVKKPTERLREHNEGKSRYTKAFAPWKLVYYELFYCKLCAEKREKFLKSGFGYKFRKMIIEHKDELK